MTLTPTLKFDPSSARNSFRGKLVESKNSRLTALWKGLCFFFFFSLLFSDSNFSEERRYTHPTFWNVNFSMFFFLFSKWFRYGWKFFFLNIIYAFGLGAIFLFEVERFFFLLVYFVNLIFGNIEFFFFFFFYYFAIVPFILNLEFWNREDSFFVFLYYHIYLILNEILCDF